MNVRLLLLIGLLVIAVAMIAPVAAGNTTAIAGNPAVTLQISITKSTISMTLTPPGTNSDTSASLSVSANCPFYVTAKDTMDNSKPSGTAGYMVNWTGSAWATLGDGTTIIGDHLGDKMDISGTTQAQTSVSEITALSASDQTLYTGTASYVNGQSLPLSFNQNVQYSDPRLPGSNVYRIPVNFAITAT